MESFWVLGRTYGLALTQWSCKIYYKNRNLEDPPPNV